MEFRFITTADPLYKEELALRFELLRKPLNMPQGSEAFPFEEESLHLVAVEGGRVVGCVLFKPEGNSGRIFQMAVAKDFQGRGIGRALMTELEARLVDEGYEDAYIHAREPVLGFYEGLGFGLTGDPFEEVGIEHRKMIKRLSRQPDAIVPGRIALAHKPVVDMMLASFPPEISEQTFTNAFVWRGSRDLRIAEQDGAIVIYEVWGDDAMIMGPPIGELSTAKAAAAVEAASGKAVTAVVRLPERAIAEAAAIPWAIAEDRDNFDYVYRREDLAELAGRNYHAKRNLIAQCLAEHDCAYEEISRQNLAEVRDMMDRWCKTRACGQEPGLCHEYQALKELFDHYWELRVSGAAIRVDKKIEAFTVGERLNANTAVIHFEKAMPEFKGLYQLINQLFCKNQLSGFEYVNREQDLGIEGLRKAKESYFPHHLVKKFTAFPHGIERGQELAGHKEIRCPE